MTVGRKPNSWGQNIELHSDPLSALIGSGVVDRSRYGCRSKLNPVCSKESIWTPKFTNETYLADLFENNQIILKSRGALGLQLSSC